MAESPRPTREQVDDLAALAELRDTAREVAAEALFPLDIADGATEHDCAAVVVDALHDRGLLRRPADAEVRALRAELAEIHDAIRPRTDPSLPQRRDDPEEIRARIAALEARTPQPADESDGLEFAGAYAWGGGAPNGAPILDPQPAVPDGRKLCWFPVKGAAPVGGLAARCILPVGHGRDVPCVPESEPAVPDGEDARRQAVLDRQRGELGWGRWLSRAAEKVRRARSGPGEAAAVAELIRALDAPRPSVEGSRWSARDGGDCIRCDATGPHVPLTSCRVCGVTWLRTDVPDGAPDGEDVPARLEAAADACEALGWTGTANTFRDLASQLREWDEETPEVRSAVAAALARPTGHQP